MKNSYDYKIKSFLNKNTNDNKDELLTDISKSFNSMLEDNNSPVHSLSCKVRNNLLVISLSFIALIVVGFIGYKSVTSLKDRSTAKSIYQEIVDQLKSGNVETDHDIDYGISENDIVDKYKKRHSEGYFGKHIMPYLDNFRKKGGKVKKFNERQHGRDIVKWQYVG